MDSLLHLPPQELVAKIIDLETVLCEFQESSKELEQALELELAELERTHKQTQKALVETQNALVEAHRRTQATANEITVLQEASHNQKKVHEEQMRALKSQIVSIEIANDSMESHDRVVQNKLELTTQFNNELLEKLALAESELERERKHSAELQLYITNYQNEVRMLRSSNEGKGYEEGYKEGYAKGIQDINISTGSPKSDHTNSSDSPNRTLTNTEKIDGKPSLAITNSPSFDTSFDTSMISMREVLRAGPPRKSGSLQRLHEITTEMNTFMRTSTVLKSAPTTSTSRVQSNQCDEEQTKPRISLDYTRLRQISPRPRSAPDRKEVPKEFPKKKSSRSFSASLPPALELIGVRSRSRSDTKEKKKYTIN